MTLPLLVVDASTYRGTAAIVQAGRVLGEAQTQMRGADEERLMPAIAALFRDTGLSAAMLGGIVCGEGPGSFTSLRIAASIAKGIVTVSRQPLYAVSSLLLVVAGAGERLAPGRYLALLDAMRGEWFCARAALDAHGGASLEGEFELVDAPAVHRITTAEQRIAIGPGQAIDASPEARGVARLADVSRALRAVDPAVWEPSYGRLAEAQARWERSHGRPLVA
jgi:tRNA threonylcarbamoyladenosine biosynthesis protein TsaB